MQEVRNFTVRDLRKKQFFMLDDIYLNGYARFLDAHTTVVYLSLCRHADKEQSCFASQKLIAQEHNIGERTVRDKIKLLEAWNIIRVERIRSDDGKWLNNTYFLVDKDEWKRPEATLACGQPEATDCSNQRQPLPHKETHTKETHTSLIVKQKFSSLKDINDSVIEEISLDYKVPLSFVKLELEKLRNYCEAKGKIYKNYKAALKKFVLDDAQKQVERINNDKYRAVDARNL